MKLYLASGNAHKAAELQALAAEAKLPLEIVSARAMGGMPPVEEDTGTFLGNARKKALALREKLPAGSWVLADDSGLCVDALDGGPGVESAYYAGPQGDGAANLAKLVSAMRGVPEPKRGAHFVCVLVVLDGNGGEIVAEGRVDGRLRRMPRGGAGFGYDPLFVPEGSSLSMAEMPEVEKNRVSHRYRAWQVLAPKLAAGWMG
ncbi:MAG TPA: RdgB/HAM1 family non-canonical purine NTP pyrophosphatase [Opitutaceae bacterium]|nr:RdgB/HAM1 family non-canonical purine NTP pyrophosphatase [Opitutaceae bacterium]